MSKKLELSLKNDIGEVGVVLDALEAFGEEHGIPQKPLFQLKLVLDELITNIVSYGFDDRTDSVIGLTVAFAGGALDVELVDNGAPFDPVAAPIPDSGGSLDERRIGGLGLKFVRTFADSLDYRRVGGFNHLHLQLDINAADPRRTEGTIGA